MQNNYVSINSLKVSEKLLSFINDELLIGTGISTKKFWSGFEKAVHELSPKNKELLKVREKLKKKMMIGT